MKIYISDKEKLVCYTLPNKIEDSYLINYTSSNGISERLTLFAENNCWNITSTYDIKIIKGGISVTKDILSDDASYQIKFNDLEETITLYCFDVPMKYYDYDFGNRAVVTLGRQKTDLQFDSPYIGTPHFSINKYKNSWVFMDSGNESLVTYINGKRTHKQVIQLGDVIFTNGLKIIWMETFIRINNPNKKIKTVLQPYKGFTLLNEGNKYTPVKETEKSITLYGENDVFFHTPRVKNYLNQTVISISPPPPESKNDGPPAIITLGSSLIFGISSTVTSVVSIFNMAKGNTSAIKFITQILICVAMIMGSLLFPMIIDRYNKHRMKKREIKRKKVYTEYLEEKSNAIKNEMKRQYDILFQNNLSIGQLEKNILEKNNQVWNREIIDEDFLTVRLGIGKKSANIQVNFPYEEFSLDEVDKLKEEAKKIAGSSVILNDVPITISLAENKVIPLIISNNFQYKQQFVNSLMLQLFTYCSGMDLKIIVFTDEENKDKWEYIKFLSHCYSTDKKTHFFSTNEEEMKQIALYLEKEYNTRLGSMSSNKSDADRTVKVEDESKVYKNFDTYYLIITDQFIKTNKLGIINRILNSTMNLGFSLLLIEPTMKNIPSQSSSFIEISNANCSISDKNLNSNLFKPEIMPEEIKKYSQIIANIPIDTMKNQASLPTNISFLEMYQVGKIEQLNILNRWQNNDPVISLHAPIGVNEEGKLFELDLHEKVHGPHGLIAGATGSGKSEFIITFILSLAVNYHPYEVQFVLIDYKGGGLAGAFENRETGMKIPHLAGTITNLDTSEMNRTLVSIKSELKRRQKMFNDARDSLNESTVDIYKYQRFYRDGKVNEPISHLFIISDEFAELKSQQPDFMEELISTARIGRSLGVHLILATQKPSGVVNDQIWSNSRFKVCLKVQTAEDSMELLKRKEAASIKETGRFYLQVGYNESFELGQSAWAGARYHPTDRMIKNVNDSIDFINNNGDVVKSINDKITYDVKENYGDQLTNIVKTLYNIAVRENINFKQLWLPSIPKEIYITSLTEKYNYKPSPYYVNPLVGEYDVPESQYQGPLTVDLTNNGNLILYGTAGSGKENLLQTIIYSVCLNHSPEEANFYILDFGSEVLKVFENMPHVGDVALSDDHEKVKSCFLMLEKEINRRKELFAEYGGTYTSYINQSSDKVPLIITVLSGYENFMENCGEYNDYLAHLLRDCTKYGIVFIMTAVASNSLNTRISQSFTNRFALQLTDNFDYVYLLGAHSGVTPAKIFGRGLTSIGGNVVEFQSAYIYLKAQITNTIKSTIDQLNGVYNIKAPKIPIIPKIVSSDTMLPYIESFNNVPIGINMYNASVERFNFDTTNIPLILGKTTIINNSFIVNLVNVLSSIADIKLRVIDFMGNFPSGENYECYNGTFTDVIKNITVEEKNTKIKVVYLVVGISYIYDKVLDEGIEEFNKILNNYDKYKNVKYIFADNYPSHRKMLKESWYKKVVDNKNCIWVNQGLELQNIVPVNKISKSDINNIAANTIFKIENGNYTVIKGMGNQG